MTARGFNENAPLLLGKSLLFLTGALGDFGSLDDSDILNYYILVWNDKSFIRGRQRPGNPVSAAGGARSSAAGLGGGAQERVVCRMGRGLLREMRASENRSAIKAGGKGCRKVSW